MIFFFFFKLNYFLGPFSWPFIGNQILLKRLSRKFGGQHKAFMELSKRYNSDIITVNISYEKIIVVSGSKFCDMILQNEEFQGRPWNEFIKVRNMGKKQGTLKFEYILKQISKIQFYNYTI